MNLLRPLAIAAVVGWAMAGAVLSCSANGDSPSDAGTDSVARDVSGPDAGSDSTSMGNDPTLAQLSVFPTVAGDAAPSTLLPKFSPAIHDYYVLCVAGENALTVSMTASRGATSQLKRPLESPAVQEQSLKVRVAEGQAVVAQAAAGTKTLEYWVRCLPHDFPDLQWVVHDDAGTRAPGYYLLGNQETNDGAAYAIVLDSNGVPVWYFREPTGVFDIENLVPGAISFIPYPQGTNPFEIHHLSPLRKTDVGSNVDPHELRVLPNGDYLVFDSSLQTGVDLTGLNLPLLDGGTEPLGPNSPIQACNIHELDRTGKVVWSWIGTDHFDLAVDSTYPLPAGFVPVDGGVAIETYDGSPIVDPFHCNSIDVDPANGNLLVSARHLDSIFYVEKATGKVLWKMGGPKASKDDATYVGVADPFFRQHDARLLPGWSADCNGGTGQISLFDDETAVVGPARAIVYSVTVGAGDGGATDCDGGLPVGVDAGSASRVWQWKGTTTSNFSGSFRITADGSRIIGWGASNVFGLVFTEVSQDGRNLVELYSPNDIISYRAIKIPVSAFDLTTLRKTAGL
jgi:hypothetical protein